MRRPIRMIGKKDWREPVKMSRSRYFLVLILMTLTWLVWGLAHRYLLLGIGLDAPIIAYVGAYSLAWAAGYVVLILPAGMGVREGVLSVLLAPYMVTGGGALCALLSRTAILFAELTAFMIGLIIRGGLGLSTPNLD